MGEAVIVQLQNEARIEQLLARCTDDGMPLVPEVDVLASAQSRRSAMDLSK